MKITAYSFGNITVENNTYAYDVIIYPDRVFSPWWRNEGHLLQIEDVADIIKAGVPVLIIGTGYNGTMIVPDETLTHFRRHKVKVSVEDTRNAVKLYNEISPHEQVIAALHLTC